MSRLARELALAEEAREPDHALRHFLRDLEEDYAEGLAAEVVGREYWEDYGDVPAAWLDAAERHFQDYQPDGLAWFAAFRRAAEEL